MIRPSAAAPLLLALGAVRAAGYPPPVEALIERGVEIETRFEAPSGLTGYVARADGREVVLYLTPDGGQVVVGRMLDGEGNDLTAAQLERHLPEPELDGAWSRMEEAVWIREGGPQAERVVYVFTDPDCVPCQELWRTTHAYLGVDVQVRNILVGVRTPDSMGKAVGILAADDPARAFSRHQSYGSRPPEEIPPALRGRIEANNELMRQLGAKDVPAVFYRDREGRVRRILGMPSREQLTGEVFRKEPR